MQPQAGAALELPPGPPALGLALRSERAACEVAQQALHRLIEPAQPSPRALFGLDLVLEELLMNQVLHAHPEAASPAPLSLQAWLADDTLVLHLADGGIAFDPLALPPPEAVQRLEDARVGGFGLHLVRRYARRLAYERADGLNHLVVELALR